MRELSLSELNLVAGASGESQGSKAANDARMAVIVALTNYGMKEGKLQVDDLVQSYQKHGTKGIMSVVGGVPNITLVRSVAVLSSFFGNRSGDNYCNDGTNYGKDGGDY